jgi:hypothetical protein
MWISLDECLKTLHWSMSSDIEFRYEHVDRDWRALGEKKYDRDKKGGSKIIRKMKI